MDSVFDIVEGESCCVVCGSRSIANYTELSLGSSRTSQSETPFERKLCDILLDSWVTVDGEGTICSQCYHLVDRFDALETQLEAIRRELTEKFTGRPGFEKDRPKKVPTEVKRKRRHYAKRKNQSRDETNGYLPPEQVMEHSGEAGNAWSNNSVQSQQPGEMTSTVGGSGWEKQQASTQVPGPALIYDNDPEFFNPGERLRVGTESDCNGAIAYACAYCDRFATTADDLKRHVRSEHCPRALPAPLPPEMNSNAAMNCGVQLANLSNAPPDSAKPFACVFCDAAFKFKSNISLHFREKHTPHKPFACADCSEGFRRSMELSRHKVYYCPHRKKNLPRKDNKSNSYSS